MAPSGCRVLVVDDDPLVREALTVALSSQGFEVASAADGYGALELLRVQQPSVVLLDLEMPTMDGWRFRAEQVRDKRIASVPVVVLSGRGDAARQARALGVAGGLQKPFDLDELEDKLCRAARARHAPPGAGQSSGP